MTSECRGPIAVGKTTTQDLVERFSQDLRDIKRYHNIDRITNGDPKINGDGGKLNGFMLFCSHMCKAKTPIFLTIEGDDYYDIKIGLPINYYDDALRTDLNMLTESYSTWKCSHAKHVGFV